MFCLHICKRKRDAKLTSLRLIKSVDSTRYLLPAGSLSEPKHNENRRECDTEKQREAVAERLPNATASISAHGVLLSLLPNSVNPEDESNNEPNARTNEQNDCSDETEPEQFNHFPSCSSCYQPRRLCDRQSCPITVVKR